MLGPRESHLSDTGTVTPEEPSFRDSGDSLTLSTQEAPSADPALTVRFPFGSSDRKPDGRRVKKTDGRGKGHRRP